MRSRQAFVRVCIGGLIVLSAATGRVWAEQLFPADPAQAQPLSVELHFPMAALKRLKADKTEAFAANLIVIDGDSATELPLRVSPRGKSRRLQCRFPPLSLDFKKKSTAGSIFAGQNKLKLVTHCSRSFAKKDYLAAEMLVYRLLNILTDASFRVRALHMTYIDGDKRETYPAFLIEHKKQLAKRLGGEVLETSQIAMADLAVKHATLMELFAYMVANTDFSLRRGPADECCHNGVPIRVDATSEHVDGSGQTLVVPYDFDATGLVNPPYAKPSPAMRIRRVTQRQYRGYCDHNDAISGVIAELMERKTDIMQLVGEFDDIPGLRHERGEKYLQEFFKIIASPQQVEKKLTKRCR